MFYKTQTSSAQTKYIEQLKLIGSLSNLFSDSKVPYLYYRVAEKIFCDVFGAYDLSRGDVALDACKDKIGIGLKTFIAKNHKSFQKIAEFQGTKELYSTQSPVEIVKIISQLRNQRVVFAQNINSVEKSFYHCVLREEDNFKLYEEELHLIDTEHIADVKNKKNTITFNDGLFEYSFNLSKSTLFKRFISNNYLVEFEVKRVKNPLEAIEECFTSKRIEYERDIKVIDTIYLPLYGRDNVVYPKSGLNQWNAAGRERDINEIYIPIPMKVHNCKKDFFPARDTPFDLVLPNKQILQTKICQDNSKALMSYSNKALGKWLLRDVLNLKEGEILTYKKLLELGIDSVRIDKLSNSKFEINFAKVDSYENFTNNCV